MVEAGDTAMEAPVPASVPPQPPEYHFHDAPVPSEPPVTLSVVAPPQIGLGLAEALVGSVEGVFNVTVTETQPVVLQVPSALT